MKKLLFLALAFVGSLHVAAGDLRADFAQVASEQKGMNPAARVGATYAARCARLLEGGLSALKPLVDVRLGGLALVGLAPVDARAFQVAEGTRDGFRVFAFSERLGTRTRELVVRPEGDLKAAAAEVWDPRQGTATRPYVDDAGLVHLVFAPHQTLFLVWPAADAPAPALPLWFVEPVGCEIPLRVADQVTTAQDGGRALAKAQWIWHPEAKTRVGFATLRTAFEVADAAKVSSAVLTFSCDNGAVLKLNGREIGVQANQSESWKTLSVLKDVRGALVTGRNVLEVRGENILVGDAGLIASLDLTADGKPLQIVTDDRTWEASIDGKPFVKAWRVGRYGDQPWGRFNARGFAEQKPLPEVRTTEITFDLGAVVPSERVFFVCEGALAGADCALELNGSFVGGCKGAPYQLELTRGLHAHANKLRVWGGAKKPRLVKMAPAAGPYDLRAEYQAEPLGVVKPRFFWKCAGGKPDAFQLTVATSPERLDEGNIYSGTTAEYLYVEPALELAPFTRYWWQVKGGGAAAQGSFVSGVETWTKPFFKRAWKWNVNEYWRARKTVELNAPTSVILSVTSRGVHKLYVNGRPASEGFGPNRSHIEDGILLAETYDVTPLVRDGVNEFELLLDDGWARFATCRKESCVSIDGRAQTADGVVVIDSQEPWLVSHTGMAHIGPWGWSFGGEKLLDRPVVEGEVAGVPVKENFSISCDVSDRDAIVKEIRPVSIEPSDRDGEWRIDFGEEFTGFVRLRLKGSPGSVAALTFSDQYITSCSYEQRWQLVFNCGEGVFENKLNWMAGRYLYLSGCAEPACEDVTGLSIGCTARRTGGFTGDADLEKVLALDTDTFLATTLSGVTMDCPHRERLGYGEASLSSMWGGGLPYFDSAAYYYAYLLKWASSQEPNGHIPHVSPDFNGGGGTFWSNFPIYALSDFWRYYPDRRLQDVIRPVAEKWLDYLDAHTKDGILEKYESGQYGCLGDWATPDGTRKDWGGSREAVFFNCCAYAWAIRQALALEGLITDPARRAVLAERLAIVQRAIDRAYYRDGLYLDEHARYQVMGLVSGAAEVNGHRDATERALLDITEWKGYIDGGSPSFTTILRLLATTPRGRELALRALRRETYPGYLFFANEGYNTLPEYWTAGKMSIGSMIHTCYTGAAGTLAYGFAGFDIQGDRIDVAPFLSPALPNFACHVETLYGTLALTVESRNGKKTVWILYPDGCHGTFAPTNSALHPGLNRFEI